MRFILLLIFVSFFLSCANQATSSSEYSPSPALGKTASEIPNRIWVVFQDSRGNYWFGSNGQGVFVYDGSSLKQLTTAEGLINNTIRGIQEDGAGDVYIETPDGISKFDSKGLTTLEVIRSPNNEWKLSPDDLWFGYNANHVRRYDGKSLYELKLPEQDIEMAYGLSQTSPVDYKYSPYVVFGIDKDRKGNVWFGTVLAGAFRYDGESFLWVSEPELSERSDGTVPGV